MTTLKVADYTSSEKLSGRILEDLWTEKNLNRRVKDLLAEVRVLDYLNDNRELLAQRILHTQLALFPELEEFDITTHSWSGMETTTYTSSDGEREFLGRVRISSTIPRELFDALSPCMDGVSIWNLDNKDSLPKLEGQIILIDSRMLMIWVFESEVELEEIALLESMGLIRREPESYSYNAPQAYLTCGGF